MNRTITYPIPAVSDCPVCWRELIPVFTRIFPMAIESAIATDERARVNYMGTAFDIIPEFNPGHAPAFTVWGPPHLNQFPDTI